jgi:hypothetical protein
MASDSTSANVSAAVSQTTGSGSSKTSSPSGDQKQETVDEKKTVDVNDIKQSEEQEAYAWLDEECKRTGETEIFLTLFPGAIAIQIYRKLDDGTWVVSNNRPAFDLYGPSAEKCFPFQKLSQHDIALALSYKNSGTPSREPSEFLLFLGDDDD